MIPVLMGAVIPLLVGGCLLWFSIPSLPVSLRISIGIGLGAGLLSYAYFIALVSGVPASVAELLLVCAALGFALWSSRRFGADDVRQGAGGGHSKAAAVYLAMVSFSAAAAFLRILMREPHGGWDAWSSWNLRARFLATPFWLRGFSPALFATRSSYPVLLGSYIARTWRLTGTQDTLTPAVGAILFTFATTLLLISAVAFFKDRALAFGAGILLLGTQFFVVHGASETADIPLSFFTLATIVCLALGSRFKDGDGMLYATSGVLASLGAWTKNDGWTLIVAAALVLALVTVRQRRSNSLKPLAYFFAGLLPGVIVILFFKLKVAPADEYLAGRTGATYTALLFDPPRYHELARSILYTLGFHAHDRTFLFPEIGLAFYMAVFGLDQNRNRLVICSSGAILGIIFVGYCGALIISPYDLYWQSRMSMDRLVVQLLPSLIFTLSLMFQPVDAPSRGLAGA